MDAAAPKSHYGTVVFGRLTHEKIERTIEDLSQHAWLIHYGKNKATLGYVGIENRQRDLGRRRPALSNPQTSLSHQRNFFLVTVEAFEK